MSLTHEKLTELYPENKDAILGITTEELDNINQFLNGAVDISPTVLLKGSTIWLTREHKMETTNVKNKGHGTPLQQQACGYGPNSIPKLPSGTPYTVTLDGNTITLTVSYVYYSASHLTSGSATGVIDSE